MSYLPLQLKDPVPSDIVVARSQTPKNVTILANEIGLIPSEVSPLCVSVKVRIDNHLTSLSSSD